MATIGAVPVFVVVNDAISPVPEAARPIVVLLLVHAYVVTPTVLFVVKVTGVVAEPTQSAWFPMLFTWPAGFTITSTVTEVPVQTPIAGVMVYLTVAGAVDVLRRVCTMLLPLPFENPEAVPLTRAAVHE